MLFETYPVYCHRMFSGKNGFQTLDTFGRIAYTCAYFRPLPGWFTDRTAIVTPLSPIVCKVIVPPFSERTRALSRFTGAVPKSTLLYTAHVSVLWNKICHPWNVSVGSR